MKRLFVDTETTGLSAAKHQVLTVGMLIVDMDKDKMEVIDKKEISIKHVDYIVQPMALKINNINLEEHDKKSMDVEEACRSISNFIGKNTLRYEQICGHNINFDIGFLKSLFEPTETAYPFHYLSIDTMSLWFSLINAGKIPKLGFSSLTKIANHYKIGIEGAHGALVDCVITAGVYQKMLQEM